MAASFIPRLRPCSYGYSSLWKTVRCLISGAVFHSRTNFPARGRANAALCDSRRDGSTLQRPHHVPDYHHCRDDKHGVSGRAADAVHSRTSYSKATPSESFSSNHFAAAPAFAKTLRWSGSPRPACWRRHRSRRLASYLHLICPYAAALASG